MSPRKRFITQANLQKVAARTWDASMQASTHDPDHAKELCDLRKRIEVLERQMVRIGAPLYRTKGNLHVQRVRNLPEADYKLRVQ